MKRPTLGTSVVLVLLLAALSVPAGAAAVSGSHLWFDTVYNTEGDGHEWAVAVTTDAAGYPIVVGNAVTAAAGDFDIRYLSYDLAGMWRWNSVATTWDNPVNPGADETVAGVVVDDSRGCAYVAGTTQSAAGDNDIVLLKVVDSLMGWLPGQLVWAKSPGTVVGRDDEAEAVAMDSSGNVYVTGGARRVDGSMDVVTRKIRPSGSVAWTRRHNNSTTRFDCGFAIAVRGSAVYVAGLSNRKGHGDGLVLIRYAAAGDRRWVRYYDDPLQRHESVTGLAVGAGVVYVCGSGKATATKPGDALVVKYLSDGTLDWAKWTAGSAGGDDAWVDVAVDAKGRAHVTGYLKRAATGDDIVTRVFRSGGTTAWQAGFSTAGRKMDVGTALAVEPGGRTYVCGFRTGVLGDVDIVALKYSATGTTSWITAYPDPSGYPAETDPGDDWPTDIVVAGSAAYVVGRQVVDHGGLVDADFLTLAIGR